MKHHVRAGRLFSKAELERIRAATQEAERQTTGEIAVVVVNESSHYRETEILGGVFLGGLVSLILTDLFFHSSVWFYIPLVFILFFPSSMLFKQLPAAKMAFIGTKRKNRAVQERALKAFYEKGLYRTKGSTGVLFFLSLLERKVWVLADKGIHERIKQERLNGFARSISNGIRDNRACDALCAAIAETGALLAEHFPVGLGENIDELTDEVICEPEGITHPD